MEQMQEFLLESLKSVDLKTVTKKDLKQKYLKEKGLTKLSSEEKNIFSSLVEKVYVNYLKCKPLNNISEEKKIIKISDSSIASENKNETNKADVNGTDLVSSPLKSEESTLRSELVEDAEVSQEDAAKNSLKKNTFDSDNASPNNNDKEDSHNSRDISLHFLGCSPKLKIMSEKSCSDEIESPLESAKKQRKMSPKKLMEDSEDDDEPLVSVKRNLKKRNISLLESDDESESPIKKRTKKKFLSSFDKAEDKSLMNGKSPHKKNIPDESLMKNEIAKNKGNRTKKENTSKINAKKVNKAFNDSFDIQGKSDDDDFQTTPKSPYNKSFENHKNKLSASKKNQNFVLDSNNKKKTLKSSKSAAKLNESPLVSDKKNKLKKNIKNKDTYDSESDGEPLQSLKLKMKNGNLNTGVDSKPSEISGSESDDEPFMSHQSKNINNSEIDSSDSDVPLESLKSNKQSSTSDICSDNRSKEHNISLKEKVKNKSRISKAKKKLNFYNESPISKKIKVKEHPPKTPEITSSDSDEDLISLNSNVKNGTTCEINTDSSNSDMLLDSLKKKKQISPASEISHDKLNDESLTFLESNKNEVSLKECPVTIESNVLSVKNNEQESPFKSSGNESDSFSLKKHNSSRSSLKKELVSDSDEDFLNVKKKANKSNSSSLLDTSDSEEEPLSLKKSSKKVSLSTKGVRKKISSPGKKLKQNQSSKGTKRKISSSRTDETPKSQAVVSSDSDDELPLKLSKKKPKKEAMNKINSTKQKKSKNEKMLVVEKSKTEQVAKAKKSVIDSSESDDEPLTKLKRDLSNNKHQKSVIDSSESDDEPLTKLKSDLSNNKYQKSVIDSSESDDEPLTKLKSDLSNNQHQKSVSNSSESDDEPLTKLKSDLSNNKHEKIDNKNNSDDSSLSSEIEDEENLALAKKKTKEEKNKTENPKVQKKLSASENKLENMKKYIRAAGLRVQSYTKLFENCKSIKSKCEKLQQMLEKHGLKGRPTLEKCRKLKKKIETKKEVAELDLSNIITKDRKKRIACTDTTNYQENADTVPPVKTFSRLKDIVDSEESD